MHSPKPTEAPSSAARPPHPRDRPRGVGGDTTAQQTPRAHRGPGGGCTAEQPSRTQPGSGQPSPTGARHPNRGRLLAASEARRPRSARQARRPSPPQGWLLTFGKARKPSQVPHDRPSEPNRGPAPRRGKRVLRDRPHGVGGDAPVQQIPPGPTGAPRVACTAEQPDRTQPGSGQPSPTGARHPPRGAAARSERGP